MILNFSENQSSPLNFRRIFYFLFFFIVTANFKNSMYPRSFFFDEAKIKQHTSSKKQLCEIGEQAIWESRFTCFLFHVSDFFFQIFIKWTNWFLHENNTKKLLTNWQQNCPINNQIMDSVENKLVDFSEFI